MMQPAANNRIVFINPPYERISPGYSFIKHITNRSPSLGLLHLAAERTFHRVIPLQQDGQPRELLFRQLAGMFPRVNAGFMAKLQGHLVPHAVQVPQRESCGLVVGNIDAEQTRHVLSPKPDNCVG